MNRKKWALLTALLLATAAPLPTPTPTTLISAASAKHRVESAPTRDTDGDPDAFGEGKPIGFPRPGTTEIGEPAKTSVRVGDVINRNFFLRLLLTVLRLF